MTLELNKPYLVKRVANNGGTLHFVPHEGFCYGYGITLNKPALAQRVAMKDGKLHFLMGDQQLDDDGKLILNKPYLAKRVAANDGKLHYLVNGKRCTEPPPPCDCCGCPGGVVPTGSLTATVSTSFGDPVTLTMVHGSPGGDSNLSCDAGTSGDYGTNHQWGAFYRELSSPTSATMTLCDGSSPIDILVTIMRQVSLLLTCRWYRTTTGRICSVWDLSGEYWDRTSGTIKDITFGAKNRNTSDSVATLPLVDRYVMRDNPGPNLSQLGCDPLQFEASGGVYCFSAAPPEDQWGYTDYASVVGATWGVDISA